MPIKSRNVDRCMENTVITVRYRAIKISNLYKFEIHMAVIKLDH